MVCTTRFVFALLHLQAFARVALEGRQSLGFVYLHVERSRKSRYLICDEQFDTLLKTLLTKAV